MFQMQKSSMSVIAMLMLLMVMILIPHPACATDANPAQSLLNSMRKANQMTEGTGTRTLYILFDPNCPSCHKLFVELRPYIRQGTLTIHWIPAGILTPSSPGKAAALLQSKHPLQAFYRSEENWNFGGMRGGDIPPLNDPNAKTRHALKINDDILAAYGLDGVPVTVFNTTYGSPFYFEGTPPRAKLAEILKYVK